MSDTEQRLREIRRRGNRVHNALRDLGLLIDADLSWMRAVMRQQAREIARLEESLSEATTMIGNMTAEIMRLREVNSHDSARGRLVEHRPDAAEPATRELV